MKAKCLLILLFMCGCTGGGTATKPENGRTRKTKETDSETAAKPDNKKPDTKKADEDMTGTGVPFVLEKFQKPAKGAEAWNGAADCSVNASIALKDGAFVVTVHVTDDEIMLDHQYLHENDSVEFYFDVRPAADRGGESYDKGVFQIIVVPSAEAGKEKVGWYQASYGGGEWSKVDGTKITSTITEGKGFSVTLTLPVKGFAEHHMLPGKKFNFDIGINDKDKTGVRTQILWRGSENNWKDPTGFGKVELK